MSQENNWKNGLEKIKVYKVLIREHYGVDMHNYSASFVDSKGLKKLNPKRSCYSHDDNCSSDVHEFEEFSVSELISQALETERLRIEKEVEDIMPSPEQIDYQEENYYAGGRDALLEVLSIVRPKI